MNNKNTYFERAIFLSWYCSKGDCTFCYMSTQKNLIKDPRKAIRRFESVFAEAIITKACGWKVEFISGGYDSYSIDEIAFILNNIKRITKKKLWINIGTLNENELKVLVPYIKGYAGTVECINPKIHDLVCPSKPIKPIIETYKICDRLGLKKGMTLIIGLGETIQDFILLKKFISENNISRITFYSLNPQKGTPFKKSPAIQYYRQWIEKTRKAFPDMDIIAGAWYDKTKYISEMLLAGADSFTKFPAIKYFNSRYAKEIESEIIKAKRNFCGTFTKLPKADWKKEVDNLDVSKELKERTFEKINMYLERMKRN